MTADAGGPAASIGQPRAQAVVRSAAPTATGCPTAVSIGMSLLWSP